MPFEKIDRRRLLVGVAATGVTAVSGGLFFVVRRQRQQRWAAAVSRGEQFAPNVYVALEKTGKITIFVTKTEMGQGTMTALAAILCEELDAKWADVHVELPALDHRFDYGSMYTAASSSVSSLWTELRRAGAAARSMLLEAGAEHLELAVDDCNTHDSRVWSKDKQRSVSYGELAIAAADKTPPLRPRMKSPEAFTLVGQDIARVDIPEKTQGLARYGIDFRPPDALTAVVRHCPWNEGSVDRVDETQTRLIDGVVDVIRLKSGVVVVADHFWAAMEGQQRLQVTWSRPPYRPNTDDLRRQLSQSLEQEGLPVESSGPSEFERDGLHESDYHVPFLAHAQMEPLSCTVKLSTDRCELWLSTQNPDAVRNTAASILGMSTSQVVVHRTLVGGGFGRRTHTDETAEAVQIAQQVQRPLQLIWSREEDIQHGVYREMAAHRLRGQLNSEATSLELRHRIATTSNQEHPEEATAPDDLAVMGSTDIPYARSSFRVEWSGVRSPVRQGILRSVGYSHNTFAIESFVDELAHLKKLDPLALRLSLLPSDSRLAVCIKRVAKTSSWRDIPHLGLAVCSCFGSHIALVVDAEFDDHQKPTLRHAWAAVDCGIAIHPDNIRAQIEGGIAFGLSAALGGRISVQDGIVVESNFHDYPVVRQSDMPKIDVELIASGEAPGGVGELSVPVVAPALCNSLFRRTGTRHRSLPLIPHNERPT